MRLHVISHRRWLARDLAVTDRAEVVHSLGLDIPQGLVAGEPMWAPMEWAARLVKDYPRPLADPGPAWLTYLPVGVVERDVVCIHADQVRPDDHRYGFWKPANTKIEAVPAQWTTGADFRRQLDQAGVPATTEVLVTRARLEFEAEFRLFILDGEPVAASVYLIGDVTWHDGMSHPALASAVAFGRDVLSSRLVRERSPRAFVMDAGLLTTGRWTVIEANPAWCSNPYEADPDGAVETIIAANSEADPRLTWTPDPYLVERVARQRPLRVK